MSKEKPVILYDSQEAATYRTDIKGWVSAGGLYCGDGKDGEHMARYNGATHIKCQNCDTIIEARSWTICETCRSLKNWAAFCDLPYKEYDGSPVFLFDQSEYFFSEDDLTDYMVDNSIDQIDLLCTEPNNWFEVDADYWADIIPEDSDGDLPKPLEDALTHLNKVIELLPPCSYAAAKNRTSYSLNKP